MEPVHLLFASPLRNYPAMQQNDAVDGTGDGAPMPDANAAHLFQSSYISKLPHDAVSNVLRFSSSRPNRVNWAEELPPRALCDFPGAVLPLFRELFVTRGSFSVASSILGNAFSAICVSNRLHHRRRTQQSTSHAWERFFRTWLTSNSPSRPYSKRKRTPSYATATCFVRLLCASNGTMNRQTKRLRPEGAVACAGR